MTPEHESCPSCGRAMADASEPRWRGWWRVAARVFISLVLIAANARAQKKPKPAPEPPKTYPTERAFAASCDTVWPVALQVFIANGWDVKTSDRTGGIVSLHWTKGFFHGGARAVNPVVAQHTTAPVSSFKHQFERFEPISASAISAPSGTTACKYSVSIIYQGKEIGEPNRVLDSNGWFEDKMLEQIDAKIRSASMY